MSVEKKVCGVRIGKLKNKTDMAVLICEELVRPNIAEAIVRLEKAGDDAMAKKAASAAAKAAGRGPMRGGRAAGGIAGRGRHWWWWR